MHDLFWQFSLKQWDPSKLIGQLTQHWGNTLYFAFLYWFSSATIQIIHPKPNIFFLHFHHLLHITPSFKSHIYFLLQNTDNGFVQATWFHTNKVHYDYGCQTRFLVPHTFQNTWNIAQKLHGLLFFFCPFVAWQLLVPIYFDYTKRAAQTFY